MNRWSSKKASRKWFYKLFSVLALIIFLEYKTYLNSKLRLSPKKIEVTDLTRTTKNVDITSIDGLSDNEVLQKLKTVNNDSFTWVSLFCLRSLSVKLRLNM